MSKLCYRGLCYMEWILRCVQHSLTLSDVTDGINWNDDAKTEDRCSISYSLVSFDHLNENSVKILC